MGRCDALFPAGVIVGKMNSVTHRIVIFLNFLNMFSFLVSLLVSIPGVIAFYCLSAAVEKNHYPVFRAIGSRASVMVRSVTSHRAIIKLEC